jgi:undecaprenyl-diphosphatase
VISLGVASASAHFIAVTAARPRPDRVGLKHFASREVAMPASASFPSRHAASGFAFSYAIGRHIPELGLPVRLLASAIAYSRVHIGVHYPGDVVVGSLIGSGSPRWSRRPAMTFSRHEPSARATEPGRAKLA